MEVGLEAKGDIKMSNTEEREPRRVRRAVKEINTK